MTETQTQTQTQTLTQTQTQTPFAWVSALSPARLKTLTRAVELGAPPEVLDVLARALLVWRGETIVLPPHRFEALSRGSGWARCGRGDSATWGERVDGGYRVGPGRWSVGGHDGYSRKKSNDWDVRHVTVGEQTWTVAS